MHEKRCVGHDCSRLTKWKNDNHVKTITAQLSWQATRYSVTLVHLPDSRILWFAFVSHLLLLLVYGKTSWDNPRMGRLPADRDTRFPPIPGQGQVHAPSAVSRPTPTSTFFPKVKRYRVNAVIQRYKQLQYAIFIYRVRGQPTRT